MVADLGKMDFKFGVQSSAHLVHLRQLINVHLAAVVLNHQLVQAPEHLLFVLDVEQEQSNDVVHPLDVAYLFVVVCISHKDVVQFVVASIEVTSIGIPLPEVQLMHCPVNIFHDSLVVFFVREETQLSIHVVCMLASHGVDI